MPDPKVEGKERTMQPNEPHYSKTGKGRKRRLGTGQHKAWKNFMTRKYGPGGKSGNEKGGPAKKYVPPGNESHMNPRIMK